MAITGLLLAYLASHQKQLQLESSLVARILSRVRSETTLDAALETTGRELLRAFGARGLAIAVREARGGQAALWTLNEAISEMNRLLLTPAEADALPVEGTGGVRAQTASVKDDNHGGQERERRRTGDHRGARSVVQHRARRLRVVRRPLVRPRVPVRSRAALQQR